MRILVFGGRGALGSKLLSYCKQKGEWIIAAGFQSSSDANENVVLTNRDNFMAQSAECESQLVGLQKQLNLEPNFLDAVVCVAGGWRGGNAASDSFIQGCDDVIKQSIWSSVVAAQVASKHLKAGGLLVLSGAAAASNPTPYMMGYGMAKAAVHQLTKSLAAPKSGLPENSSVACLLINTLDTEQNRTAMPKADFSKWTSSEFIATLIHKWTIDASSREPSGSLVELKTENSKTTMNIV